MRIERLNIGDSVGIFLPASPVKAAFRDRGRRVIEEMGFGIEECPSIFSNCGFIAKNSENVISDLNGLLKKKLKLIWGARGGYGSNYLLPHMDKDLKIDADFRPFLVGSSDMSYLLWQYMKRFSTPVLYGPMAYASVAERQFDSQQFLDIVLKRVDRIVLEGSPLISGHAEGIVQGGCLSNLVSLLSTPFLPDLQKTILLLEDVGERPYRLDRLFWQLDQSGILANINGLVLGSFPNCFLDENERKGFYTRIVRLMTPYKVPVLADLPVGHGEMIQTIPLGISMVLETRHSASLEGRLDFIR